MTDPDDRVNGHGDAPAFDDHEGLVDWDALQAWIETADVPGSGPRSTIVRAARSAPGSVPGSGGAGHNQHRIGLEQENRR